MSNALPLLVIRCDGERSDNTIIPFKLWPRARAVAKGFVLISPIIKYLLPRVGPQCKHANRNHHAGAQLSLNCSTQRGF